MTSDEIRIAIDHAHPTRPIRVSMSLGDTHVESYCPSAAFAKAVIGRMLEDLLGADPVTVVGGEDA